MDMAPKQDSGVRFPVERLEERRRGSFPTCGLGGGRGDLTGGLDPERQDIQEGGVSGKPEKSVSKHGHISLSEASERSGGVIDANWVLNLPTRWC